MNKYYWVQFFRRHGLNLMLVTAMLFLFLHPGARPWLMRRMFDLGLFTAQLALITPDKAPKVVSFQYHQAGKGNMDLAALHGNWVLLNFWAPWCPPCRAELPSLEQLAKYTSKQGLQLLLVDMEGDVQRSQTLLQQMHITVPNVIPLTSPDKMLFAGTLPTTVLLDPAGKMVWKHEGLANYDHPRFLAQLRTIMHQERRDKREAQ